LGPPVPSSPLPQHQTGLAADLHSRKLSPRAPPATSSPTPRLPWQHPLLHTRRRPPPSTPPSPSLHAETLDERHGHLSLASPLCLPWRHSPLQHRRRPQPWPPPPLPSLVGDPLNSSPSPGSSPIPPLADYQPHRRPPSLPPEMYRCGETDRRIPAAPDR
uniref:Uncharacterized protein n=1 Tax=Aegilops tauschii subsp. strangulata TaxID=200361 RepID=A0A453SYA4_AEGTS